MYAGIAKRTDLDQQSEAETHNTKISDSGYSTGCSNSQSQRSGSSKSIHSNSCSSNSSGYGGLPTTAEEFPQPHSKSKVKDHKKKKNKSQEVITVTEKSSGEVQDAELNEKKDVVGCNIPVCVNNSNYTNGNNAGANNLNKSGNNNTSGAKNTILSSDNNSGGNVNSAETQHMATVAQTLKCIKKIRNSEAELETNLENLEANEKLDTPESLFNSLKIEPLGSTNGQFSLVVSMQDGKVLYTTPTLTDTLGFPSDMWIGRSFIDFVHHKDRIAFANHITVGLAGPMISVPSPGKTSKTTSNTFFCCLRKYRGLKNSGFGVKDKAVEYVPFKLSLSFKEVKGEMSDTLLTITAAAVKTAFNRPDEMREAPKFVTRHLANTLLSHVDVEAVSYLGYLPQDIIGRSVLDFYHPEDLPLLKEIYESILEVQGSPYRSKPYRFRTQNGGYVVLETEWSSFINPWSKKLEFAIGQHRLLKGPPNPDVFAVPKETLQISEEVMKENKCIQDEIKRILNEPVSRSSETAKQQVSKRCKDLASFMESLMDKITKSDNEKNCEGQLTEESFSERDSVMLGEISPHHDHCDSKSSSETPPSYNQLNYNENLQRFFESKPRTMTANEDNTDIKIHSPLEEEGKTSPEIADNGKCRSPVNGSGTCSGSGSGLSSASNCIIGTNSTETNPSKPQGYKEPVTVLTEAVLSRHNEDMEKVLIKRHRDLRVKEGKIHETRLKSAIEKLQDQCHGVKRSGSQSWEGDKVPKHRHTESSGQNPTKKNLNAPNIISRTELSIKANVVDANGVHLYRQGPTNVNLWPPFSVTTFNQSVTPQATYTSSGGMPVAGMIPVYYIPTGGNPSMNSSTSLYSQSNTNGNEISANEHPGPPGSLFMEGNTFMNQVQFMNAFPVYPAMGLGTPSLMYSPLMMAPQVPPKLQRNKIQIESEKGSVKFQRPASQATSVKAEPGSAMGSMALSECSKKEEKSTDFTEIEDSLCSSQDEDKAKEMSEMARDSGTGDESSFSSYSSFLKTDESMKSLEEVEPGFSIKTIRWDKESKELLPRPFRKDPPWLKEINLTPELMFRYQLNNREITNVLESDFEVLQTIDQPKLVDDQLNQLYVDLELEGLSTKLKLEEGLTTSSCSSGEELQGTSPQKQIRKKKKQHDYTQLVMIYEENMPLPSPSQTTVVIN